MVAGKPQEVFFCDILQCIEALFSNLEFAPFCSSSQSAIMQTLTIPSMFNLT